MCTKNILALALGGALLVGCLTGCGSGYFGCLAETSFCLKCILNVD